MEQLQAYLPLLIPVLVIQLGLMAAALLDLVRRERTRGPKWAWALAIILINLIGPMAYFVAGRLDE
jgi:hypothetical protein